MLSPYVMAPLVETVLEGEQVVLPATVLKLLNSSKVRPEKYTEFTLRSVLRSMLKLPPVIRWWVMVLHLRIQCKKQKLRHPKITVTGGSYFQGEMHGPSRTRHRPLMGWK